MWFNHERRGKFRNGLQYSYSIGILLGTLACAYFMMEKEPDDRRVTDAISSVGPLRLDAGIGDEALARLIEVEKQLTSLKDAPVKLKDSKRVPDRPIAQKP